MWAMLFKVLFLVALAALPQERLADRVAAVVNGEPILLSELRQTIPDDALESAPMRTLLQANLSAQINQTLILQEVKRLKAFTVEPEEVENFIETFLSSEQMEAELDRIGMTPEGLRKKVKRMLLVRKFVEYRFRRYTAIDETRLLEFYRGKEWLESYRLRYPDSPEPSFEEVRDELILLLEERAINDALDEWLNNARDKARIVIKL